MRDQKTEALRLIATGCERVTRGWCGDGVEDWTPYAAYMNDRWCYSCIAKAALEGTLPRKMVCIEA
jgi:hypothetical protein